MSTPHLELTDALLRESLSRRASGAATSGALVRDVLAAVDALPQAGRWSLPNLRRWRTLPAVAVVALPPAALIASLFLAGGNPRPAPPPGVGEIAFVHSLYACDVQPCTVEEDGFPGMKIPGLHAVEPRILTVRGDGGVPAPLLDVPGAPQDLGSYSWGTNPRNNQLSGPAVSWSPDGTRLAFRLFNDVPGIYVVHRSGIGATRLVELPLDEGGGMVFSPGRPTAHGSRSPTRTGGPTRCCSSSMPRTAG